jgi:PD-(D/E)XK nuclease superfamily protein
MVWSVSTAKMFDRCQRQWFYKQHFGNARAKDETRRRAYLLGKLQTISGWRGSLVDQVLSSEVIPGLERGEEASETLTLASAMARFDRQLAIARRHRIHEPGFKPSACGGDFVAFYRIEYGDGVSDTEIEQARDDVRKAISTFFSMEKLVHRLRAAQRLVPQRRLIFAHTDTKVGAIPDDIVFPEEGPPAVVDWKVHTFGWQDAWLQLAIYAAALTRAESHADFPVALGRYKPADIGLLEVQLLTGTLRKHVVSDEDVEHADAYIARSAESMLLAAGERTDKISELSPSVFPAARYAATCGTCPYRSLCWDTMQ